MPFRRHLAVLLTVAVAAVAPAAAFAQSGGAGNDQYVDPYGGSNSKPHHTSSSGSGSPSTTSTGPALSATPTLSAQAPATTGSSAAPVTTSAQTLPRTGVDVRLVVLAGALLLFAGVGLRRRLAHERL